MADVIQTTFGLNDQMSKSLTGIINVLEDLSSCTEDLMENLEGVDKSSFNSLQKNLDSLKYNTKDLAKETEKAEGSLGSLNSSSLDSLKSNLSKTASALNDVTGTSNQAEQSLNGLNKQSLGGLESSIDGVESSLNEINNAAGKASASMSRIGGSGLSGVGSSAKQAKQAVGSLGSEFGDLKGDIDEATDSMKNLANVDVNNDSVSNLQDTLSHLGDAINLSNWTNLTEIVSNVVEKVGELATATMDAAGRMNDVYNSVTVSLGTTAQETEQIVGEAKEAFASGYGESLDDVTQKAIYLKQVMGTSLEGVDLSSLIAQFDTLEGSGMDFNETVRAAKNMTVSFGISTQEAMDLLTAGFQDGLNYTDEFGDNIAEYAARWGQAGMSASQYFSILQAGTANGAYNLDKVGDFLNEFKTALDDGRIAENIGNFSAQTQELFAVYQESGQGASEVLSSITSELGTMANKSEEAALSSAMFGSLGEDNNLKMIESLGGVADKYTEVNGLAQQTADANSNAVTTLHNKWTLLKDEALAPVGNMFAELALGALNLGESLGQLFTGQVSPIEFFNNIKTSIDTSLAAIKEQIQTAVDDIIENFPTYASKIGSMIPQIFEGFTSSGLDLVNAGLQIGMSLVTGFIQALPAIIQGGISFVSNLIMGIFSSIPRLLDEGLTIVENLLAGITQNYPTILQKGADAIGAFLNGIAQSWPNIVQAGISMIIGIAQTLQEHLPTILQRGLELVWTLITGIVQAFPDLMQKAQEAIMWVATTIWNNREQIMQTGIDLLCALRDGLGQFMGYLWDTLLSIGSNIVEGIKQGAMNVWDSITSWFGDRWNELITNVKSFFGIASPSTVMADVGTNLMQGLWNGLQGMWDGLKNFAGTIWDSIKGVFTGGNQEEEQGQVIDYTAQIEQTKAQLQQLQLEVANGYNQILATVQTVNGQIVNAGITMFATMASTVIGDAATMVNGINAQLFLIPSSLAMALAGAIPVAQEYFGILSQMAHAQVGDMVATAQNALLALIPAFGSVLEDLRTKSVALLKELQVQAVGVINVMSNNVVVTIRTMSSSMLGLLGLLANNFIYMLSTMTASVIGLMTNLCAQLVSLMRGLVRDITNTINTLPPTFRSVGKSMMESLKAGINDSKQSVIDATSELVQKLKTTFETGLGIHSPSDYMIWVGQMLIAGLLEGLSDSQVQSFVESIIQDMQSSFEAGKFNANELVNYLSDDATINLIGKLSGMDLGKGDPQQIAYPLIGTLGTQTSWFGLRESPGGVGSTNHQGADLAAPTGTPIAAALAGTVTTAGGYGGYGNAVVVDSGSGLSIVYGHMSQVLTSVGQQVGKGAQIGLVGSTGWSTGPHLHFEMRQDGTAFDPQPYLEGAAISSGNTLQNAIQQAYNLKHGIVAGGTSMGNIAFDISAGASQWTPQVLQALQMLGQPASLLSGVLYAIECESGGDPNAINLRDINAEMGDPSRGLLQTIGATFNSYRNPSLSANIYDPLSNIYAGLNYMIQRYGSVDAVVTPRLGHWYGYSVGTRYVPDDMLAMIHKGEAILPASQNPYSESGGDYLADIATKIIPHGLDVSTEEPNSSPVMTADINSGITEPSIVDSFDVASAIGSTTNVATNNYSFSITFGDINNHGDLDNAKEEILDFVQRDLIDQMNSGGNVQHVY